MKSNSNSIASSSLGDKSPNEYQGRKRIRKRIRKDQDGSRFRNQDSLPSKSSGNSMHGIEEIKTPGKTSHDKFLKNKSYTEVSNFNNNFINEGNSSHFPMKRKSRREIRSDAEDDHHSDSSSKPVLNKVKVKVKKIDDEGIYHHIVSLLQTDDRVKSIIKSERANFRKLKYEYNKKRHFMGPSMINNDQYKEEERAGYNEIIDSMLEKFESLQLPGFESLKQMHVKYLEDKLRKMDVHIHQQLIDEIKLMDIEQWEISLTDKEKRKIKKRSQDQRRIIKRLRDSDIGQVDEFEI